jgi:hypothetical protein
MFLAWIGFRWGFFPAGRHGAESARCLSGSKRCAIYRQGPAVPLAVKRVRQKRNSAADGSAALLVS